MDPEDSSTLRQAQGTNDPAQGTNDPAQGTNEPAHGAERHRHGLLFGLGAYLLWGSVPLYWPLLGRASATEILAHRVLWSLVILGLLAVLILPRGWWRPLVKRRTLSLLGLAAALIAVNWGLYIWSVNSGQVVEAALGYYINPIFSVLLGVIVLGERLAVAQWVALGFAVVAVLILTVDYGRPPWIALTLAATFATYGLLKNRINSGAVATLTVESALLTPLALAYLIFLQLTGGLTFAHLGVGHSLLLMSAGLVTLVPLLFFSAAAVRLPLSTLGLLQYLTPTAQFLLGVFYFGEAMPPARWAGFTLIWIALAILSGYGLLRASRARDNRRQLVRRGSVDV